MARAQRQASFTNKTITVYNHWSRRRNSVSFNDKKFNIQPSISLDWPYFSNVIPRWEWVLVIQLDSQVNSDRNFVGESCMKPGSTINSIRRRYKNLQILARSLYTQPTKCSCVSRVCIGIDANEYYNSPLSAYQRVSSGSYTPFALIRHFAILLYPIPAMKQT